MQNDEIFNAYMLAVYSARKRAGKRGSSCELTREVAESMWTRCEGKCEVTGIEFSLEEDSGARRRAWAPSLDRKDPSIGYTESNSRVVCVAVNLAMNEWGEAALYRIAVGILANGRMRRMAGSKSHGIALPMDIRLYRGVKRLRYGARARDFGQEVHLGTFQSIDEALDARLDWARKHNSEKVLRQVLDYTQDPALAEEIYLKFPDSYLTMRDQSVSC